ncbi:MAG: bla regulator protein BlaR1 [Enterobacterales bacterium]|jgi:bla regulator protein BlaR1
MIVEFTLFATLAFHHLLIGSILVIILTVTFLVFNVSPEMRSWLWITGFMMATVIPVTLISEPTEMIITATPVNISQPPVQANTAIKSDKQALTIDAKQNQWHAPAEFVFKISGLLKLFLMVWIAGSLWRAFNLFKAHLRTKKVSNSSRESETLEPLAKQYQLSLSESDQLSTPSVIGVLSPKIMIPVSFIEKFSLEQLVPIVLHEQAHIQRKDTWFALIQEFIAVVFWWSPIIRILNKKIHVDRELACDLRAAKQLSNKQYAQSLVDCARIMVTQNRSVLAMGLFSQKKELSHRIEQVLKNKKIVQPSLLAIIGVCLSLSIATFGATQQFSPKVSLVEAKSDAKHYSLLPSRDGKRLIEAVLREDIDTIKRLQSEGVDIDTPAIGDGTALIIAVKRKNKTMVEALLGLGADVNQSSRGDANPLITAAMINNIEIAEILIHHGADVNGIVPRDETPLINATRRGYLKMSKFLVENGADVNLAVNTGVLDGSKIRSPLNMASDSEVRNYLIAQGAVQ